MTESTNCNTLDEMIQMDLVKYLDEYDKLEKQPKNQKYMIRFAFLVRRIQELKGLIAK